MAEKRPFEILVTVTLFAVVCSQKQSHLPLAINKILQEQSKVSEINFIVDWSSLSQYKALSGDGISASVFDAETIVYTTKSRIKACPIIIPFKNMTHKDKAKMVKEDELFQRQDITIKAAKQPLTMVIWVSWVNIKKVINYIEDTVMWCPQRVDLGLLDIDTSYIFIADNVNDTSRVIRDAVLLETERIRKHPHVIVLESRERAIFQSYNTYHKENESQKIKTKLWSPGIPSEIFPSINYLNGQKLRVITALFAHYVQAAFLSDGGQPNKRLTEHNGLIPDYLTIFTKHYGASIEFLNPEPIFDYGGILDDGFWSGQVRMLWDDVGDTSCELAYNYPFRQLMTGNGYGEPEYLSFASPKYVLKSKIFALLKPFDLLIWLFIVATILIIPVVFYVLGIKYHAISNFQPIQIFNDLMWFSFSIFMGEVKVSEIKIIPLTQRGILGSWLLFSMVMGFAYSGSLKSHLMTPESVPPIDSLKGIVESSLRVKMAVYDDVFDQELATTSDPVRSQLWTMHEPLQEFRGPLTDVEKGEAVNINWKAHLNAMIKIHHSTTDGTELIHLGDEAILFKTFLTCAYTPEKPWGPHLDRFTRHFEAAGLFHYLKEKSLRRLRREERNEDRKVTSPFLDQTCPEGACPLVLEHFVGTGIIYVVCLTCSFLTLLAEVSVSISKLGKRKLRDLKSYKIKINCC